MILSRAIAKAVRPARCRSDAHPTPPNKQQAVHACCVAGATDAAVRTLDEMALMGFAPSTFIYNVAMEACARTGVGFWLVDFGLIYIL